MSKLFPAMLLTLACAQARQSSPSVSPGSTPLAPPSSILAVLAHRDALRLDSTQATELLEIQKQLEHENNEVRDRFAAPARSEASGHDASGPGPLGRHRSLGEGHGGTGSHPQPVDRAEAFAQAVADNDTRAFLRTEPVFHKDQWERAREIAERYRMDYADRQDSLRWQGTEHAK